MNLIKDNLVQQFDPDKSANEIKFKLSSLNRMTVEVVTEIHKARVFYSVSGFRSDLVPNGTRLKTFEAYLESAGLAKRTAYNWLERYIPEEQKLLTYEEFIAKKESARIERLSKNDRDRALIAEYRKTKVKPTGWTAELDKRFNIKEDEENSKKQQERIDKYKEEQNKNSAKNNFTNTEKIFSTDILNQAANMFIAQTEKRTAWKEKIRLSADGKDDAFMDAIIDYMETLENDTRRIEACNNIIKICRNISVELQKVAA